MAVFFILGPSRWDLGRLNETPHYTPIEERRLLASLLQPHNHTAFIMEDEEDIAGEDAPAKFLRILKQRNVTHCLIYWPLGAKMDATQDEMVVLQTLSTLHQDVPQLWILAQENTLQEVNGELYVHEGETGRSSYIKTIMSRIPGFLINWKNNEDLERIVHDNARAMTERQKQQSPR